MNFDAFSFTMPDVVIASVCAGLPLLISPVSIDGRSTWRVIVDSVKELFKGLR